VTCGRGVRTRTRKYEMREAYKRCSPHPNSPRLQQNDICYGAEGEICENSAENSQVSWETIYYINHHMSRMQNNAYYC